MVELWADIANKVVQLLKNYPSNKYARKYKLYYILYLNTILTVSKLHSNQRFLYNISKDKFILRPLLPHTHHLLWLPLSRWLLLLKLTVHENCCQSSFQASLLHLCCQLSIPEHFPLRMPHLLDPSITLQAHQHTQPLTTTPSSGKHWQQTDSRFPRPPSSPRNSPPLSAFHEKVISFFPWANKLISSYFPRICSCSGLCLWVYRKCSRCSCTRTDSLYLLYLWG